MARVSVHFHFFVVLPRVYREPASRARCRPVPCDTCHAAEKKGLPLGRLGRSGGRSKGDGRDVQAGQALIGLSRIVCGTDRGGGGTGGGERSRKREIERCEKVAMTEGRGKGGPAIERKKRRPPPL